MRRLYREWGNLKECLKVFVIAIAVCFERAAAIV